MDFADDPPIVFLDTSALAAVFDKSDQWHERAKTYWQVHVIDAVPRPKVVLSDYIIDELATHIRSLGHARAVAAIELLLTMIGRGAFALVQIDKAQNNRFILCIVGVELREMPGSKSRPPNVAKKTTRPELAMEQVCFTPASHRG